MWEYELLKIDEGLLQKVNTKQKKKIKKLIQSSAPSEYMGQDFTKLDDLIKELKSLGVMKSDKKLSKKLSKIDEANISLTTAASELSKGELGEEKDEWRKWNATTVKRVSR